MTTTPAVHPSPRRFQQIDVFTAEPGHGNPLAVVLDGSGMDDAAMQRFARWTNLSETTFVLPPTDPAADYQVRIFTPGGELPFAGHPTLGTCHAWLQAGGQPRAKDGITQQCGVGLVRLRRDGERLAFAAPPLKRCAPSPVLLAQVAAALGLKPQQVRSAQLLDNGPVWLGLLLDNAQTVLQLAPDHLALKRLGQKVGVAGLWPLTSHLTSNSDASAPALEVRAFAAPIGVPEDPVTGSLNASLAQWLMADGVLPNHYIAAQGACLGRAGRVHIARENNEDNNNGSGGTLWVGGDCVTCIAGQLVW